jgi:hypothetical protein
MGCDWVGAWSRGRMKTVDAVYQNLLELFGVFLDRLALQEQL